LSVAKKWFLHSLRCRLMKHDKLKFLTWTSLALCVISISLWLFSSFYSGELSIRIRARSFAITLGLGEVGVLIQPAAPQWSRWRVELERVDRSLYLNPPMILGFGHGRTPFSDWWVAPLWLPIWASFFFCVW